MKNTYASKPVVSAMGWTSLRGDKKRNGIESEPTGHIAVGRLYGLETGSCLGFRLIKTNNVIAVFSDRSNSLNGNKTDARVVMNHPAGTDVAALPVAANVTHVMQIHREYATAEESLTVNHDIYIADTLGELSSFNQFTKAAFVGGSLIERGGHNIMEPTQYACPTVVGQHTHNFYDMVARMLNKNALTVAKDENDVAAFLVEAREGNNELLASAQRAQLVAIADQQAVIDSY